KVVLWDAREHRRVLTLPQNSPVHDVVFDAEGLRLAVAGVETLITVWNFALIRPELAGIGLDWLAAPPAAGSARGLPALRPAPSVKVVVGPERPAAGDVLASLEALQRQARYAEVITLAEKAIRDDPGGKHLYVPLAGAHYRLG